MELKIDFGEPVFDRAAAARLSTGDLDSFYASALEPDRLNLFFMLEASFHQYADAGEGALAARLAFLAAYYLFVPLTPPASHELAMHYICEAVRLDPLPEYREWRELIRQGN